MINHVVKKSGEYFDSGFFCAESVLLAIAEYKNVTSDLIPRIATGFCSGLARTGDICGAVSGAVLALSMILGRNAHEESPEDNYRAVRTFMERFQHRFGTTNCFGLIDCKLDTPEGQEKFKNEKLFNRCRQYTEEATQIALSIIEKTEKP